MIRCAILWVVVGLADLPNPAVYIQQINAERVRCGAAPLTLDPRLQKVAQARVRQLGVEFSHSPGGVDPKPALLRQYGFPVGRAIHYWGEIQYNCSEGIGMGSAGPVGLGWPPEQFPHESAWLPRRFTHHNDMICPRWTLVGHAWGRSPQGVLVSATVYGCPP